MRYFNRKVKNRPWRRRVYRKKRLVNMVKKVMNYALEKKHVHLQDNLIPVSTAGHVFLINKIGLGAQDYQRVGNSCKTLRIGLRGQVMPSTENVAVDVYNQVRMLVLYDRQPNGALPSTLDILTYGDVNSPRNPDFAYRFTTLADKSFQVYNKAGQAYQGRRFRINIKKRLMMQYKGDTNTIADISSGSIFVFWLSDSLVADHPFVSYNTAITYTDA